MDNNQAFLFRLCRHDLVTGLFLLGHFFIMAVAIIIITAVYDGWATPTEAGALGAFIVLITAFLNGMRWPALKAALMETSKLVVMIFCLIWVFR